MYKQIKKWVFYLVSHCQNWQLNSPPLFSYGASKYLNKFLKLQCISSTECTPAWELNFQTNLKIIFNSAVFYNLIIITLNIFN